MTHSYTTSRDLTEFVISGASTVIGIDAAESITREARKLDETAGGYVEYLNTIAEATGLP